MKITFMKYDLTRFFGNVFKNSKSFNKKGERFL